MGIKPILFNTEMVKALLANRKTVTRRVVKPQPVLKGGFWELGPCGWSDGIQKVVPIPGHTLYNRAPYHPGDILYVRETWAFDTGDPEDEIGTGVFAYKADGKESPTGKWRPSIHMPKEAARLFLRVTGVRVERLQDMQPYDVAFEGFRRQRDFIALWDSTLKPTDIILYGWAANPWVWVIEFERISKEEPLCPTHT